MAALTASVHRSGAAVDLGPGGRQAARTTGPAGGDRSAAVSSGTRSVRSWPLVVLAAPAAAEVFSGWAGIAKMTGFGLVSPLPGIWPSLHLDTSITLPVGVEAYAAYALRAWLSGGHAVSGRTRRFAKWSAICSFTLGMAGQVASHLLAQAGAAQAPWPVTTVVSCLPVLVLAMGPRWLTCCTPTPASQRTHRATRSADQQDRGPRPGPPGTRQVRPRTRPHPGRLWPGPVLPQGPLRPRSRTTTPERQHPACPASARHAWRPAGSQQRESRYPDVPCAARESRAPTTPWAPWRARSTPSWRAQQLSRPDPEHRRRTNLILRRRTVLCSTLARPAASPRLVPSAGHDRLPGETRLGARFCRAAAVADCAGTGTICTRPVLGYSLQFCSTETVMPDDAVYDDVQATMPALRTLAGKVNWLISAAAPPAAARTATPRSRP